MTALCGGGTSQPRPGVNEVIIFGTSQIASWLNNKGGLWATLAVGALGVLSYEATQLCSTDPPPTPTLTSTDYSALLNLAPHDELLTALGKLKDLITVGLWHELCECTSGTTPPPSPTLFTPPAGVTLPDFSLTPCAQPRWRQNHRPGQLAGPIGSNVTTQVFPNLPSYTAVATDTDHPADEIVAIPSTWSSLRLTSQLVSGSTPTTQGYSLVVDSYGATRSFLRTLANTAAGTGHEVQQSPENGVTNLQGTDRFIRVTAGSGTQVTVPGVVDHAMTIACTGTGTAQNGCCPDPVVLAMLNVLMQSVNEIRSEALELQRYILPFSYIPGPNHTGLTGTGSAPIERSVGLKITVTGQPLGNRTFLGEPPYIMDLGWVSVLTPDGLLDEIRLTRTTTSWLSKLIPSSTRVGWGLRDGVTATIQELKAEP